MAVHLHASQILVRPVTAVTGPLSAALMPAGRTETKTTTTPKTATTG